MDILSIEFNGEQYEIKYTFKLIKHLKLKGVNVSRISTAMSLEGANISDFMEEVSCCAAHTLAFYGCKFPVDGGVSDIEEIMWRQFQASKGLMEACTKLFFWIVRQHFYASENLPKNLDSEDVSVKKDGKKKKKT